MTDSIPGRDPSTAGPFSTLDELIISTQDQLVSLLHETCQDRPVVRLGLCNHLNVGDVALNVAETRLLHRASARVSSFTTSDRPNPSPASVPPEAAFVLQGGGNIGDLYSGELELRVAALRDYPGQPMLQMPQTIYFRDLHNAEAYRAAVAKAKRYVLLVRDKASYEWATRYLDCRVELVPDAALSLGRLERPVPPTRPVVALIRSDVESAGQLASMPPGIEAIDWPVEGRFRHDFSVWARWLIELASKHHVDLPPQVHHLLFHRLSSARLRRGLQTLSQGEHVVTDRLHGHILSSLLGIPHIVLDNSYGKVSGFMDTWHTHTIAPIVRLPVPASTAQIQAALELLTFTASPEPPPTPLWRWKGSAH